MTAPLLTIGAFARAVGLSPSTLRHYDECGLLRPAEVDDLTGYRYYTPDLADRARLVGRMRDVGMPIAAMRTVLAGPPDVARRAVQEYVEEQAARSARTSAVLDEVLGDLEPVAAQPVRVPVRGPELAAAIRQVRSAADSDPASPLSSVLLDVADGTLDVAATNRYWMAVRTLPGAPGEARVALTRADADDLARRLDRLAAATVTLGEGALEVEGTSYDGRAEPYPAHRMVVAGVEPATTRAVLAGQDLVDAVSSTRRAQVRLSVGEDGAWVEDGERRLALAGTVVGDRVTTTLGTALLQRALEAMLGAEVECGFVAPTRPVRLGSPYQQGFQALVMPIAD